MKAHVPGSWISRWVAAALMSAGIGLAPFLAADTNGAPQLIDLPTVLRLAGAQNLDVQIARERLREARAQQDQATLRFFPWLAPGVGYRRHDGNIQDVGGAIFEANKQAYTVGAALTLQVDLGDAIYQSLAARQLARAAGEAVEISRQDEVLAAATGYLELARAEASIAVLRDGLRIAEDYAA
ncbi:MAG: TolC family protein, partial [Verrucomicrobia bacterium]|nr:TolC family protein [Verrucomicrobiota bacterium]